MSLSFDVETFGPAPEVSFRICGLLFTSGILADEYISKIMGGVKGYMVVMGYVELAVGTMSGTNTENGSHGNVACLQVCNPRQCPIILSCCHVLHKK